MRRSTLAPSEDGSAASALVTPPRRSPYRRLSIPAFALSPLLLRVTVLGTKVFQQIMGRHCAETADKLAERTSRVELRY